MQKNSEIKSQSIADSPYDGFFLKKPGFPGAGKMQSQPHRDDYYMFGIITGGKAVIAVDFREITLVAGEALILTPGQVHFSLTASDDCSGWLMALAPEHLSGSELESIERYALSPAPIHLSAATQRQLGALLDILHERLDNSGVALPLAAAIRSIILTDLPSSGTGGAQRRVEITGQLKKLLDVNLRAEKQPAKYAEMLHISPSYLNEAVKNVTGVNVTALIRSRVILLAKRMLRHTSMTAQEIAYELGYDDYAYFSKLFKKEAGMSPSQFRLKP